MHVNACKTEFTELESERFQFTESLGASVDVGLFSETVESTLGVKFHGDPVVPCVMRWLFMATAVYIFHTKFSPVAPSIGQANACRVRQKDIV